ELSKLAAVVVNKWTKTSKEKEYYKGLETILKNNDILLTVPISQSAMIGKLIDEGKTIWECNSKKVLDTQAVFKAVLEVIL
ncbi:MAG: ParA family protein, partial [Fusobacteriaceae bacterium]